MTTLAEFIVIAGADNRPPMLEKSLYDSWKSHMEHYTEYRENERMILNSVQNGPLWPTVTDTDGTTPTKNLPPDVYAIVNHHKVAKEIWDKVKLLKQRTKLSLQEKECKLYDEFDKFTFVKGEKLYQYYYRFSQLINNMNVINMSMRAVQFPQLDSGLVVPVFNQGDDLIACLNKAMDFLTAVASSRFSSINNQLRTSFNPRNQATIQDGRVTVQQVQGRQGQSYVGNSYKGNATSSGGNNTGGQARVVKCYNCQGEGHIARQCTQPKRPRNAALFKEKATLTEAQEAGQILDEEQLAFLVDPGIPNGQAVQTTIPNTAAFQTEDLDAYDSDCDDVSNAKAVLMANLSSYGFDVVLEIMRTSDSNIIPYSQYLQETQLAAAHDTNLYSQQDSMSLSVIEKMSEQMINHVNNWEKANQEKNNESVTAELERYKERAKTFKQRLNIDLSTREKMIDSQMDDMIKEKLALKQQIDSLKQNLSNQRKEKKSLLQTFTVFKNESKEKENKYIDKEIDLEKKIKELDNIVYKVGQSAQTVHILTKPQAFYDNAHKQALGYQNPFYLKKAQRIKPTLYDGSVISNKHVASPVFDDEETLILEEVSRSKMLAKQNDLSSKENKVNTTPISYAELNRLSKDFGKHFVPQKELSNEQAFWLQTSHPNPDKSASSPVKIEAPQELPKLQTSHPNIDQSTSSPVKIEAPLELSKVIQIVLWYLDSGCSKYMTGNRSYLMNFVSKFLGTIRFGNDQIAKIMGYGDYQLGNIIISKVYYVEGLGHNLFSVGQFCDVDLEVAFWKNTCFIRNLEGVDLLYGSRDTNLYTISLDDMLNTSLISKDDLARGIPKLKFEKEHLCFACALGKNQKSSHQPKAEDTNQEKLYLFHMDLCGLMRVESINRKKYILTLRDFYANIGISHQTSFARTLQQSGVIERQNQTLMEADKKPDLSFLHVFCSLCYPTNDSEDFGKLNEKADITMASEQFGSGPGLQSMTPTTTSSRLVPNPIPQQPFPVAAAPRAVDTTESPVSTSIDLDAPSTSIPSTQEQERSLIISQGFEESPKNTTFS
ncbi:retrovirus-related pol polyprotein from transposon TNT 1-94 [Tanacetum coccineum]